MKLLFWIVKLAYEKWAGPSNNPLVNYYKIFFNKMRFAEFNYGVKFGISKILWISIGVASLFLKGK